MYFVDLVIQLRKNRTFLFYKLRRFRTTPAIRDSYTKTEAYFIRILFRKFNFELHCRRVHQCRQSIASPIILFECSFFFNSNCAIAYRLRNNRYCRFHCVHRVVFNGRFFVPNHTEKYLNSVRCARLHHTYSIQYKMNRLKSKFRTSAITFSNDSLVFFARRITSDCGRRRLAIFVHRQLFISITIFRNYRRTLTNTRAY